MAAFDMCVDVCFRYLWHNPLYGEGTTESFGEMRKSLGKSREKLTRDVIGGYNKHKGDSGNAG